MEWVMLHGRPMAAAVAYSILGTVILLGTFWLIEKVLPFSLRKEIAEDQNLSLGIILAAFIIGLSTIISSAIRE
jgi:putative membrane protein